MCASVRGMSGRFLSGVLAGGLFGKMGEDFLLSLFPGAEAAVICARECVYVAGIYAFKGQTSQQTNEQRGRQKKEKNRRMTIKCSR